MTTKKFMDISNEELTTIIQSIFPDVTRVDSISKHPLHNDITCHIFPVGYETTSGFILSLSEEAMSCWDFELSNFDKYKWSYQLFVRGYSDKTPSLVKLIPEDILQDLKTQAIEEYQKELRSFFDNNTVAINPKNNQPLYAAEDNTWHDLLSDFLKQYKEALDTPLAQDIMKM